ncbi:response regulator [Paenibacillus chartarius]|uniref:Response regulator n=1 Tax=Paenibacillus chartarius TaxID=747481 RepID=A0ABV6DKE2_9BACL
MVEKKQVLIVDDQLGIRVLLNEVFRSEGYEVTMAASAAEALQAVRLSMPDLVIHDLVMPDVDGWESIERLLQVNDRLPIITMSAYGPADKPRALVTKPFDIDEFISFARQVLDGTVTLKSPYYVPPSATVNSSAGGWLPSMYRKLRL